MFIEFTSSGPWGLLPAISAATGIKIEDNAINIPAGIGTGYIKSIVINQQLMILIRQYKLKEKLVIKRGPLKDGNKVIVFAFHNLHRNANDIKNDSFSLPSVQVTTAGIEYEDFFPSNANVNTLIILINADMLKDLLNPNDKSDFLQQITSGTQSFLFEEIVSPGMQELADEIIFIKEKGELQDFYYRLKAQELIYLFFKTLSRRERLSEYPPNINDMKLIYMVRDKIMEDLSINPNLTDLASYSGMSESKIKRLFKKIFGNTVYNYYQNLRIQRAALLIKEQNLSISEVGYQMGFTNLSHFARMFEKHKGIKPKKYAKTPSHAAARSFAKNF